MGSGPGTTSIAVCMTVEMGARKDVMTRLTYDCHSVKPIFRPKNKVPEVSGRLGAPAEDGAAHTHQGAARPDGFLQVGTHAHRQGIECQALRI